MVQRKEKDNFLSSTNLFFLQKHEIIVIKSHLSWRIYKIRSLIKIFPPFHHFSLLSFDSFSHPLITFIYTFDYHVSRMTKPLLSNSHSALRKNRVIIRFDINVDSTSYFFNSFSSPIVSLFATAAADVIFVF
jgi:hypothetical protein